MVRPMIPRRISSLSRKAEEVNKRDVGLVSVGVLVGMILVSVFSSSRNPSAASHNNAVRALSTTSSSTKSCLETVVSNLPAGVKPLYISTGKFDLLTDAIPTKWWLTTSPNHDSDIHGEWFAQHGQDVAVAKFHNFNATVSLSIWQPMMPCGRRIRFRWNRISVGRESVLKRIRIIGFGWDFGNAMWLERLWEGRMEMWWNCTTMASSNTNDETVDTTTRPWADGMAFFATMMDERRNTERCSWECLWRERTSRHIRQFFLGTTTVVDDRQRTMHETRKGTRSSQSMVSFVLEGTDGHHGELGGAVSL